VIIAGGTVAKLVVYPIAEGTRPNHLLTNWALCIKTGRDADPAPARQDWSRRADPAAVARHLARFRLPYLDHVGLVRSTRECFEFPMCDRDPLPHWSRGRVTLLGDAAHPMYPMGSNGAGQAILDASSLADALGRHADPVRRWWPTRTGACRPPATWCCGTAQAAPKASSTRSSAAPRTDSPG